PVAPGAKGHVLGDVEPRGEGADQPTGCDLADGAAAFVPDVKVAVAPEGHADGDAQTRRHEGRHGAVRADLADAALAAGQVRGARPVEGRAGGVGEARRERADGPVGRDLADGAVPEVGRVQVVAAVKGQARREAQARGDEGGDRPTGRDL